MAGAVIVALTLPGNDSSSVTPANEAVAPSARFDGGPSEGTRGAVSRAPADSAVTRFDGGPQEGTRRAIVRSQAPAIHRGPLGRARASTAAPTRAPAAPRSSPRRRASASTAGRRRARAARSFSTAPPRVSTAGPMRAAAARAEQLPSPDGKGPSQGPFRVRSRPTISASSGSNARTDHRRDRAGPPRYSCPASRRSRSPRRGVPGPAAVALEEHPPVVLLGVGEPGAAPIRPFIASAFSKWRSASPAPVVVARRPRYREPIPSSPRGGR